MLSHPVWTANCRRYITQSAFTILTVSTLILLVSCSPIYQSVSKSEVLKKQNHLNGNLNKDNDRFEFPAIKTKFQIALLKYEKLQLKREEMKSILIDSAIVSQNDSDVLSDTDSLKERQSQADSTPDSTSPTSKTNQSKLAQEFLKRGEIEIDLNDSSVQSGIEALVEMKLSEDQYNVHKDLISEFKLNLSRIGKDHYLLSIDSKTSIALRDFIIDNAKRIQIRSVNKIAE